MEELNGLILKKQILEEIDDNLDGNTRLNSFNTRTRLFIEYVNELINDYEKASSNIFEEDIGHLRELVSDFHKNIHTSGPYDYIKKIHRTSILLDILSYFIGRTESRKFIYI